LTHFKFVQKAYMLLRLFYHLSYSLIGCPDFPKAN